MLHNRGINPLATNNDIDRGVNPLATNNGINRGVNPLATNNDIDRGVNPLATNNDIDRGVNPLATTNVATGFTPGVFYVFLLLFSAFRRLDGFDFFDDWCRRRRCFRRFALADADVLADALDVEERDVNHKGE